MTSTSRKSLRESLRQKRHQLSPDQQSRASLSLLEEFKCSPFAKSSERVALYLANDGEIDPFPIIKQLWFQGSQVFLPCLIESHMEFSRYLPNTELQSNCYGIPEPRGTTPIQAQDLQLILLPLVGFDLRGNRLGMGGGFYDRTLAELKSCETKPLLIGLAHECQKVERLDAEEWDIPLDGVITDQGSYLFN